ncbi:unnamed protein product [Phaedon cochleariae]|uniref:Ras-GEF domain-containing protein n=1 Tax=Phaedon cochleariae TaxID=80249 RepID=A0A9P0GMI3_PHACE|nr:unnamed protein product [Phaedon cochleariae]
MSDNRVQKLLFSEYCDFEDMVLIESPFAQTTKDGIGIRQVHLGLTPSKLVLATDVLPPVEYVNFSYFPGIDPEIETFELIAIYPVECVNLSVYRTKRTQALKARFCNNKVLYFELGGFEKRAMFWNLWCERVKFLCPGESGSSRSETSVGTSSTGSTLYLLDKKFVAVNGIKQLWCKFGPNSMYDTNSLNDTVNSQIKLRNKWTDRNLYLGKNFENSEYQPGVDSLAGREFGKAPVSSKAMSKSKYQEIVTYVEEKHLGFGDLVQVNRFGSGVNEGCHAPLYLTVDEYLVPRPYSRHLEVSPTPSSTSVLNYEHLAETAVLSWEFYRVADPEKYKLKHRRRYGLATQPSFLYGFGSWDTSKAAKYSLQLKRAVSWVDLRTPCKEPEIKLHLLKKQLTSSPSFQFLNTDNIGLLSPQKVPVTFFWTPGYRYRPCSVREAYEEKLLQLKKITQYHEACTKRKRKKCSRRFLKKFYHSQNKGHKSDTDDDSNDEPFRKKSRKKKYGFIYNMFNSRIGEVSDLQTKRKPQETPFQCLKRILKVDRSLNAWDFDSTTLAEQLTMIDKDLFLKVGSVELEALLWYRSAKHAPNIAAILTFSQRISSLLATEVLKNDSEKSRARLVARFINVANKCHRMSNFHTCKTVLSGLQSPAVYRLRRTWAYVRKKHSSKYQNFESLCRFYRDPRLATYQKTFFIVSQNYPFLPYIGDIFSRLLGKIPEYQAPTYRLSLARIPSTETTKSYWSKTSEFVEDVIKYPSFMSKLLKVFSISDPLTPTKTRKSIKKAPHRKALKFKGLYEYYTPFGYYEDNRLRNLAETKLFLERCQLGAMNYNFVVNELAKSYLLKARYQEDKSNFYSSFSVESPRNCYELNKNI